ncbi:MAG: hypothetical protein C4334_10085 [Pyrinomonas sp.]
MSSAQSALKLQDRKILNGRLRLGQRRNNGHQRHEGSRRSKEISIVQRRRDDEQAREERGATFPFAHYPLCTPARRRETDGV